MFTGIIERIGKITSINDSNAICKGEVNLIEDFPILNFDCSFVGRYSVGL